MNPAASPAPLSRVATSPVPWARAAARAHRVPAPRPWTSPGAARGDLGSSTPTALLRTTDPSPTPRAARPAACQEGPSAQGSGQAADAPRPCGQPASTRPSSLCEK